MSIYDDYLYDRNEAYYMYDRRDDDVEVEREIRPEREYLVVYFLSDEKMSFDFFTVDADDEETQDYAAKYVAREYIEEWLQTEMSMFGRVDVRYVLADEEYEWAEEQTTIDLDRKARA